MTRSQKAADPWRLLADGAPSTTFGRASSMPWPPFSWSCLPAGDLVVSQLYLNEELIGRDRALEQLQGRVSGLADMLALERENANELQSNLDNVRDQLRASLTREEELEASLSTLRGENASLASELATAEARGEDLLARLAIADDRMPRCEAASMSLKRKSPP